MAPGRNSSSDTQACEAILDAGYRLSEPAVLCSSSLQLLRKWDCWNVIHLIIDKLDEHGISKRCWG